MAHSHDEEFARKIEKKIEEKARKKRHRMKVSGKSVFLLQKLMYDRTSKRRNPRKK